MLTIHQAFDIAFILSGMGMDLAWENAVRETLQKNKKIDVNRVDED